MSSDDRARLSSRRLALGVLTAVALGGCSVLLDFDRLRNGVDAGVDLAGVDLAGADLASSGGWVQSSPTLLAFGAQPDSTSAPAIAGFGNTFVVAITGGPMAQMYVGQFDPTQAVPLFTFVDTEACVGPPCTLTAPRVAASATYWMVSTRRTNGVEADFLYDATAHTSLGPGAANCIATMNLNGNDAAVSLTDHVAVAGCGDGFELNGPPQYNRTSYDLRIAQAAGSIATAWLAFTDSNGFWIMPFPVAMPNPNSTKYSLGGTAYKDLGLALTPDGQHGLVGGIDGLQALHLVSFVPGPTPAPMSMSLTGVGTTAATNTAPIGIAAVSSAQVGFLVVYESAGKVYGLPVTPVGAAQTPFVIADGAARPQVAASAQGMFGVVYIDTATNSVQAVTLTPPP